MSMETISTEPETSLIKQGVPVRLGGETARGFYVGGVYFSDNMAENHRKMASGELPPYHQFKYEQYLGQVAADIADQAARASLENQWDMA